MKLFRVEATNGRVRFIVGKDVRNAYDKFTRLNQGLHFKSITLVAETKDWSGSVPAKAADGAAETVPQLVL